MRNEACMQERDRKVSANSLGNSFRNTYADYGVVKKRRSIGYPLDEDGNYPEGWYRMTSDYRILTGEARIDELREEDVYEIIDYGWDEHDLRRMLDTGDYQAIAYLAAWIRECGSSDHGMIVEDDLTEVA